MSHTPSIVDHARVTVMTFTSPPSLPLSRPWAGWVRGYHCSRSSWFRDHQSLHLLPKFPLSHLDIWQKNWLWAFLPHQGKTADIFIPKKVWNRPIKVWKTTVFQENTCFIPEKAVHTFVDLLYTLGTFFIPCAVFHTLCICFIPWYHWYFFIPSTSFHTFWV